jgi:hypothetical protein
MISVVAKSALLCPSTSVAVPRLAITPPGELGEFAAIDRRS